MKPWDRASRAATLVACGPCLVACADAQVEQFDAALHYVCPGQQVQLSWRVSGRAILEAAPPVAGLANGRVDDEGHLTIAPLQTTDLTLHVTRFLGKPTSSVQRIRVRDDAGSPRAIAASLADSTAGCGDGKVWVTAKALHFDDGLKVATVAALPGSGRTYVVGHVGIQATLPPGAVDSQFAGAPVGGDWVIATPLQSGEACGTPTLPANLAVNITTQCVAEGHP